jgi:hypothetical protein
VFYYVDRDAFNHNYEDAINDESRTIGDGIIEESSGTVRYEAALLRDEVLDEKSCLW